MYLDTLYSLDDALQRLPQLDSILSGVSSLSTNDQSKPIGKDMLYQLLRTLNNVSIDAIQRATGYSERHCYRLAGLMRVAVNAFDSAINE